jgi:hypothetical protein
MAAGPTHTTPDVLIIHDVDLSRFARGRYLDLVIAAPKSVSILLAGYTSAGHEKSVFQTRTAHTVAVEAAFNHLQKEAGHARDGARYLDAILRLHVLDHIAAEQDTGNPHLHTHLLLDLTATGPTGRELPVDRGGVDTVRPAIHAVYDATLALELERATPIAMIRKSGSDRREVAGIDDRRLRAFRGSRCILGHQQITVTS